MIYIFDDNKHGQLAVNYRINYVEFFKNNTLVIKHISEHSENEISELIKYSKCVLIHHSFPNDIETERVKAVCKENNIPLVVFSNQYTGTVFAQESKNYIAQIKKDRMYFNLSHFVEHYKSSGEVRLDILALGKNYEAEKALIILNRLSLFLFKKYSNFDYYRNFESNSNEWKDLKELHYFASPEIDFGNIEEEFEDISAHDLLIKIKSLVNKTLQKYGYKDSCN